MPPQPLPPRVAPLAFVKRWWSTQTGPARATAVGGAAILLTTLVGIAILIANTGGAGPGQGVTVRSSKGGDILQPATPTRVVARVVGGSRDAADEDDRPKADPDPRSRLPLVRTLDGLRQYGDPPGAGFARLRIPSQGVNATVAARNVGPDGAMSSPAGPADVVWYDLSTWGLGGTPGGGGNAVFSAHVDYADIVPYANVRYQGVGVFFNIGRLQQGDSIEVDFRGQALRYAVESRRDLEEGGDWQSVLAANGSRDSITLITCSGDFDLTTRSYASRTVVRAVRL